jgi:desulfoferrodoxin (superoxide reductase-like protein)
MSFNEMQQEGLAKGRLTTNIERIGKEPLIKTDEEFLEHLKVQLGVEEVPHPVLEEYFIRFINVGIDTLEDQLADLEDNRVPKVVSRFQARAALAMAGLLDAVEAVIGQADIITRIAWQDAQEFRRDSPTIAALAATLNLTNEQLDALFIQAATITA